MGIIDLVSREGETTYTISNGLTEYSDVWSKIGGMISSNLALTTFLAGSLVVMCWRHFKRAKKAVR